MGSGSSGHSSSHSVGASSCQRSSGRTWSEEDWTRCPHRMWRCSVTFGDTDERNELVLRTVKIQRYNLLWPSVEGKIEDEASNVNVY